MLATLAISFAASLTTMAQGVYTKPCNDKKLEKKATKWAEAGNGAMDLTPHRPMLPSTFLSFTPNTRRIRSGNNCLHGLQRPISWLCQLVSIPYLALP